MATKKAAKKPVSKAAAKKTVTNRAAVKKKLPTKAPAKRRPTNQSRGELVVSQAVPAGVQLESYRVTVEGTCRVSASFVVQAVDEGAALRVMRRGLLEGIPKNFIEYGEVLLDDEPEDFRKIE